MGKLSKIAKALDMSKEARMERARATGFDTDTVYYHGTDQSSIDAFEAGDEFYAETLHMTPRKEVAEDYSYASEMPAVQKLYAIPEEIGIDLDLPGGRLLDVKEAADFIENPDWELDDFIAAGYSIGASPSKVRSVNAAFDPTKKDSSNLLAGTAAAMIGAGSLLSGEQAAASDFYQRRVAKKPKWQAMRDRSNAETTDRLGHAAPVEHEALADLANKFAAYNRWVKSKPGLDFILPEAPTELVDKWSYGQPTTLADDAEAALGLL